MPRQDWSYLKKYGMTKEDYDALLSAQDGGCAGCGRKPKGDKRLSVDHNHRTGKVRGLLDTRCNQLIGYLHEDADLLHDLAEYLRQPPADEVFVQPRIHVDAPDWDGVPCST